MKDNSFVTGVERFFSEDEIIVSKTDARGRIVYANDVFINLASYTEKELLGAAHSVVRHPDMPRCVFKLLWDTIGTGNEIFAYVINRSKNGDHYWVFAHVTPTFGPDGDIFEYHSSRRVPKRESLDQIRPVYANLLAEEARHQDPKAGMEASTQLLLDTLSGMNIRYDQLMFTLEGGRK